MLISNWCKLHPEDLIFDFLRKNFPRFFSCFSQIPWRVVSWKLLSCSEIIIKFGKSFSRTNASNFLRYENILLRMTREFNQLFTQRTENAMAEKRRFSFTISGEIFEFMWIHSFCNVWDGKSPRISRNKLPSFCFGLGKFATPSEIFSSLILSLHDKSWPIFLAFFDKWCQNVGTVADTKCLTWTYLSCSVSRAIDGDFFHFLLFHERNFNGKASDCVWKR